MMVRSESNLIQSLITTSTHTCILPSAFCLVCYNNVTLRLDYWLKCLDTADRAGTWFSVSITRVILSLVKSIEEKKHAFLRQDIIDIIPLNMSDFKKSRTMNCLLRIHWKCPNQGKCCNEPIPNPSITFCSNPSSSICDRGENIGQGCRNCDIATMDTFWSVPKKSFSTLSWTCPTWADFW